VAKNLPSDKQENKAPTKASLMFSGTQEKCVACNKTVYPIEKSSRGSSSELCLLTT
jgi:hypothetical protein